MPDTIQLKTGEQLDGKVVKVMRAIRQIESGGDYNAIGDLDRGVSKGAYQWNKNNFENQAVQFGLDPKDFSPANQNKVAYARIKSLKDEGRTPNEIAALWNGAKKLPTGQYDFINPEYGEKFRSALANETITLQQPTQFVQPPARKQVTPPQESQDGAASSEPSKQKGLAQRGLEFLFPILEKKERTALQTVGDLGLSALTLVPGAGLAGKGLQAAGLISKAVKVAPEAAGVAKGLLSSSNIAKGAAIGYGADVGTKLSEGETDITEIARPDLGTAAGGLLGGAGTLLQKAAKSLPERVVRKFIPGTNEDVAKYASTKKLGSPKTMLAESEKEIASLGSTLEKMLKNPELTYIQPEGKEIIQKVISQFPGANLSPKEVIDNLKKILPLQKGLIDKLASGKPMTLSELHQLNSRIGRAVFKTVFDDPVVRGGKDIGNEMYHTISQMIKDAVPESVPVFEKLSMEYPLRKALEKAVRSGDKRKAVGLVEILALFGGGLAHPVAGIGAAFGAHALRSPTANLVGAEALKGLSGQIPGMLGSTAMLPSIRGLIDISNQ